ncbi:MAG: DUF2505 domain-containing protein [Alphaproteobacteria bacterium]|nr:DUF2505 domain-containing protein [Alphaproteobacteria bacterium]
MKLNVRYAYPCTPERYWEMYWDDAFDAQLQANSTVKRELVEETDAGGVVTRKLRFTPENELPGPVAAIVGTKKLVYDQVNVWDRAASVMSWEVLPTFLSSDKFSAKGVFKVVPKGPGCELQIDGDIDVKVRFIGGQIEKQIVSQIEDAYAKMHTASVAWLEDNGTANLA